MGLTYTRDQIDRVYRMQRDLLDFVALNAKTGYSYGVLDEDNKFKRPESAAEGVKLYWDPENFEATGAELLKQMTFRLFPLLWCSPPSPISPHPKRHHSTNVIPSL